MDRPALARILDELVQVPYLDSLVISLNRATLGDYAEPSTTSPPTRDAR